MSWFVAEEAQVLLQMARALFQRHLVYVSIGAGVCCSDGLWLLRGVTDISSNFRLRGLPPRSTFAKVSVNLSIDEVLFIDICGSPNPSNNVGGNWEGHGDLLPEP